MFLILNRKIYFAILIFLFSCKNDKATCEEKLLDYLKNEIKYSDNKKYVFYYIPEFGCSYCANQYFYEIIKNDSNKIIYLITNRTENINSNNVIHLKDIEKKYMRLHCLGKRYAKIILSNDSVYIYNIDN